MRDQSLTKLGSRSAGAFLVFWGMQMLLGVWIPLFNGPGMTARQGITWGLVSAACGVFILLLPWDRWNPRLTFSIALGIVPLLALVAWDTQFAAGRDTVNPDAAFFIVLAWVGITQPRWYPTCFAPYIGLVYGGTLLATANTRESAYSMITCIAMATVLAEIIAWMKETILRSQLVERQRLNDVQTLTATLSRLRGMTIEDAAGVIGVAAQDLFRCARATVVLRGLDIDPTLTTYRTDGRVSADEASAFLDLARASVGEWVRVEPIRDDDRIGRHRVIVTLVTPSEEVVGIMVADLDDEPDSFTMHVARLYSTEIGTVVEQLEQVEALQQKALFDELTGIGNRRYASELLQALEPGDAVMLIDVDDFKRVNDSEGHAAGDEVLRALGRHMRSTSADAQAVARFGGDEFILVNKAGRGDAFELARRIHETWLGSSPRTTISIGVAVHDRDGSVASTLEHADVALYSSKQHGRNQVHLYSPDLVSVGSTATAN